MNNRYAHLAPVVLRVAIGVIFLVHGIPKLTQTAGVAGFFGQVGIPAPFAMAILVGLVEALGGLSLLVGYGARIASALLAVVMLVAILTVKLGAGFVGGWEFDLALLAGLLSLVLSGPVAPKAAEAK